jgi:hypothetical protein
MKIYQFLLCLLPLALCAPAANSQPPLVLLAETDNPSTSTYVKDTAVNLRFSVSGLPVGQHEEIAVEIVDELDNRIAPQTLIPLEGRIDGKIAVDLKVPSNRLGEFRVLAHLSDGTSISPAGTRPAGFITYAVVVNPTLRKDFGDQLSRFGLQGPFDGKSPLLSLLGVRYVLRGVARDWVQEEAAAPGSFLGTGHGNGSNNDDLERADSELGIRWHVYPVARIVSNRIPRWALDSKTSGRDCPFFGALNADGKRGLPLFAGKVAQIFHENFDNLRYHYYQITWEPFDKDCFNGTDEQLIEYYSLIYDKIHMVDAKALIAGPTLVFSSSSERQLDRLFSKGLGRFIDILSVHTYNPIGAHESNYPPEAYDFVGTLQRQWNIARSKSPHAIGLISTEHSFRASEIGDVQKAAGDIRESVMLIGEGAAFDIGFYLYDFWNGDIKSNRGYGFYWNLDAAANWSSHKLSPKPVAPAYSAMTYFLDGSTTLGKVSNVSGSQTGYKFARENSEIVVVWDYLGKSVYDSGISTVRVCDWMGNCQMENGHHINIDFRPVYIFTK